MKSLRMSSINVGIVGLAAALVASVACARGAPSGRGEVRGEPAGTARLQVGALIVAPARPDGEAAAPRTPRTSDACPTGMVLVEGESCPDAEQTCLEWMDPPTSRYAHFRCKRYAKPAVCKVAKVHKRYCIDATERVEPGTSLPRHFMSWTSSKALCESDGARLCRESEWVFACEGEEMRPYPYGWVRDATACNADIATGLGHIGGLVDHRAPASAHPRCTSAFGVHDMAGNVDEWATVDGAPKGTREVMKGSWWMPGRNSCRSFQGGHGASYGGTESGVRCCKDAP